MKILYLKLVNFADVYAAMHVNEIDFDFKDITKPIIQIYGKNRSGKTVLIQKMHPFSSINLNGDDRNDEPLILDGKNGMKQIIYDVDGDVYVITHTYKATSHGHTVSSSIIKNGEELNAAGGVNTFNAILDKEFGINRYIFQFVINGTQLTSFAGLNQTQRKTLLNKAMGIDIYDKIHKMSTEDYRYTSKLITSLNNTKEYLLQNYGSYETLLTTLTQTKEKFDVMSKISLDLKSQMDRLQGIITSLQSQSIDQDMFDLQQKLSTYDNVVATLGVFNPDMYDQLVEEQIRLNQELNQLKTDRLMLLKDQDVLYGKRNDVQSEMYASQRALQDYHNLIHMKEELTKKIESIVLTVMTDTPSSTFMSTLSLAQAINETCKEIVVCLNQQHLIMFCDMILNGVDIPSFLMKEGAVLMDSEKEKSTVSRIRHMLNTVEGEAIDCKYDNCLYRNTFDRLSQYFKSYESVTDRDFTQYDLEQFEHSWKNYQTILRLIRVEIPQELQYDFTTKAILTRMKTGTSECIDVEHIKQLAQQATQVELRKQYIQRLHEIDTSIHNMETLSLKSNNDPEKILQNIESELSSIQSKVSTLDQSISQLQSQLQDNESKRLQLSSIKNLDIKELRKRFESLSKQQMKLQQSMKEYQDLNVQYQQTTIDLQSIHQQLQVLEDANKQYLSTMKEIDKHSSMDQRYKIIAEATSSTKGKPVEAIRQRMKHALTLANRLLNVMYDGEIELLNPTINETVFTLPFRCGVNTSNDIKTGSQSESTLLSLALSLSLASTLTKYNVFLLDECDGYLDISMRDAYITMLQDIMSTLKMEQMFIISHSIMPNQYEHIVHTIDISHD
jgi:DNA repair exonuclease SbcCD ATPase subunit